MVPFTPASKKWDQIFSRLTCIECVRSCDQKPYLHNETKGGICIQIEFNPQKNISLLQHGRRFFVYCSNMAAVTSCEHTIDLFHFSILHVFQIQIMWQYLGGLNLCHVHYWKRMRAIMKMSNFERKYCSGYRHMICLGKTKSTSEKILVGSWWLVRPSCLRKRIYSGQHICFISSIF